MTRTLLVPSIPLCRADEVSEGAITLAVLPDGHRLALYQVDGEYFATDDTCTHGEASLAEFGSIDGHIVECSFHNGSFDVRSGEPCTMPCSIALRTWPIRIVDGQVCLVGDGQAASADG